ncbi:hypothetical protein [Ramlibacter sp.]|uniref:hypothetical protein n=1 Tax=Ramlibacter sp. TaxID=1917967 RepID=UPI003D09F886
MFGLPTEFFPFFFAALAALFGFFFSRRGQGEAIHFASRILYAVAAACVIIGLWVVVMQR